LSARGFFFGPTIRYGGVDDRRRQTPADAAGALAIDLHGPGRAADITIVTSTGYRPGMDIHTPRVTGPDIASMFADRPSGVTGR